MNQETSTTASLDYPKFTVWSPELDAPKEEFQFVELFGAIDTQSVAQRYVEDFFNSKSGLATRLCAGRTINVWVMKEYEPPMGARTAIVHQVVLIG